MKLKLFIGLLLVMGTSCNDKITISAVVLDKLSNMPLDSVSVTDLDDPGLNGYDRVSIYTLPNGRFTLLYSSREIKKKSRLPFIFQKEGYGSVVEHFPRESVNDTVYLEKLH